MDIHMDLKEILSADSETEFKLQLQEAFVQEPDMDLILKLLTDRQTILRTLISRLNKDLAGAPEGWLRITHVKGHPQYFFRKDRKDPGWTYIRKKDSSLVYDLAKKDYLLRLLRAA